MELEKCSIMAIVCVLPFETFISFVMVLSLGSSSFPPLMLLMVTQMFLFSGIRNALEIKEYCLISRDSMPSLNVSSAISSPSTERETVKLLIGCEPLFSIVKNTSFFPAVRTSSMSMLLRLRFRLCISKMVMSSKYHAVSLSVLPL